MEDKKVAISYVISCLVLRSSQTNVDTKVEGHVITKQDVSQACQAILVLEASRTVEAETTADKV